VLGINLIQGYINFMIFVLLVIHRKMNA
jgi:hypothetical protein